MHRTIAPRALYFGTPVVLISTRNEDGTANLAPMSSAWWVGRSAMLGLDATSQTTRNLVRTGEGVLNLPAADLVWAVDRLALLTGTPVVPEHKRVKGYRYEPDKFGAAGLTPVPSDVVAAPRVAECGVQLEATVHRVHPFAEDDDGLLAIDVRVEKVHVHESLVLAGSDRYVDPDAWDPLIMKFCEFYGGGVNVHPSRLAAGWGMPRRDYAGTSRSA